MVLDSRKGGSSPRLFKVTCREVIQMSTGWKMIHTVAFIELSFFFVLKSLRQCLVKCWFWVCNYTHVWHRAHRHSQERMEELCCLCLMHMEVCRAGSVQSQNWVGRLGCMTKILVQRNTEQSRKKKQKNIRPCIEGKWQESPPPPLEIPFTCQPIRLHSSVASCNTPKTNMMNKCCYCETCQSRPFVICMLFGLWNRRSYAAALCWTLYCQAHRDCPLFHFSSLHI